MDRRRSRTTVIVFALASFLNDLGSDMIYPVWPLFITGVLGGSMSVLGFLDGLGEALVSVSQAASGYLSDRFRRRKVFVWLGYLFGSGSRIGYALSTTWHHVIPFRILDRAGKMRGAPRDAMVADASCREERATSFGILRAMDNLGAVCGIVACILLFGLLGYRRLFLLAALPSGVSALLVLFLIREEGPPRGTIHQGISFSDLGRNFQRLLLLSSVFALGSFSYSFLLLYAHAFGFRSGLLPVLYLLYTAVASLASYPFGRLADRTSRKAVLMMSFLFWGLVCSSLLVLRSRPAAVAAFVLYGLHRGALEPVQKTFVSELAPKAYRASGLGAFQMVVGLCGLPSSLLAGVLWDRVGMLVPLYVSIGLTGLSLLMLSRLREGGAREASQNEKPEAQK